MLQSGNDRRTACNSARRPAGPDFERVSSHSAEHRLARAAKSALTGGRQCVAMATTRQYLGSPHDEIATARPGCAAAEPIAHVVPRAQMVAKPLAARGPLAPTLGPCRVASGRRLRPKELRAGRRGFGHVARARWTTSTTAACSISAAIETSCSMTRPNPSDTCS